MGPGMKDISPILRPGDLSMGFSTVLIISLAAGVVLVVGGGLMMYMSNLVKSAYELKVQITSDVDERLTKMAEDLDKKSRWIKRDLLEEIEKIKVALQTDNARKITEQIEPLLRRLEGLETTLKAERADTIKAIEADRQAITNLDQRLKAAVKQIQKKDDRPEEAPPAAGAESGADPAAEAALLVATAPPPAATAKPAPAAPQPVMNMLPDLGKV